MKWEDWDLLLSVLGAGGGINWDIDETRSALSGKVLIVSDETVEVY